MKMGSECVGANLRGEALSCRIGKVCRNFTPVSKLFFVYPDEENIFSRPHNVNVHVQNHPLEKDVAQLFNRQLGAGLLPGYLRLPEDYLLRKATLAIHPAMTAMMTAMMP